MIEMEVANIEKDSLVIPKQLIDHMKNQGKARLVIAYTDHWVLGYEFGTEAEDSDMTGGAAYGVGSTPLDALSSVLEQVGINV